MTKEVFIQKIQEMLYQHYGCREERITVYRAGYSPENPYEAQSIREWNVKNGREDSTALAGDMMTISKDIDSSEDHSMVVRIDLEGLFDLYKQHGMDAAVKCLCKDLDGIMDKNFCTDRLSMRMLGYEAVMDHLVLRPFNKEEMMNRIDGSVYQLCGDVALALYQIISDDREGRASVRITKKDLELWHVDEAQVMKRALENTARLYPAVVCDVRRNKEVNFLKGNYKREDISLGQMILLSTKGGIDGAVAVFYPGVVEKMTKIMKGSFLCIFMNTNDVMILPMYSPLMKGMLELGSKRNKFGDPLSRMCFIGDEHGIRPYKKSAA